MMYHFSIVKVLKAVIVVVVVDVTVGIIVFSSVTSASEFDYVNVSRKELGTLRLVSINPITHGHTHTQNNLDFSVSLKLRSFGLLKAAWQYRRLHRPNDKHPVCDVLIF